MGMKYIISILILSFIGANVFIASSNSMTVFNSNNEIKVVYAHTASREGMHKEDRMGIRIILYFDGKIEKYSINIRTEDKLIAINHITQNEINNIDKLFTQYDFLSYPEKIPSNERHMWPSSTTCIKYSQNEDSELKSFVYSSNSDSQYIPLGFKDFVQELKTQLFSYFD